VFPLEIDIDHPRWQRGLEKLRHIYAGMEEAERHGGVTGKMRKAWLSARAAVVFAGLYTIPVKTHALPESSRLQPAY
jgi:magnesium-protoporphyrin IX monomethyl ester (oxidative) cyclase